MTSSCECKGFTFSRATLLRKNLASVLPSMAVKKTGRLETIVFSIVKVEPFFTSMPFGAWLSLEKISASCPMLLVTLSDMKYFSPSPSDPDTKITEPR